MWIESGTSYGVDMTKYGFFYLTTWTLDSNIRQQD